MNIGKILCYFNLHKPNKYECYVRYRTRKQITSRRAFCERCGKALYRVDKDGERKDKK